MRLCRWLFALVVSLICSGTLSAKSFPAAESLPQADLDGPTAGWRFDGLTNHPEQACVAYPTPPIDRGAQRQRTLIEGRLRNLQGTHQPLA